MIAIFPIAIFTNYGKAKRVGVIFLDINKFCFRGEIIGQILSEHDHGWIKLHHTEDKYHAQFTNNDANIMK